MSDDEHIIPQAAPQGVPQPQPVYQSQPVPVNPQAPIANVTQQVLPAEAETMPMATPEAPVTGQTRMEAAWGSSVGDEEYSEMASVGQTGAGEIFQTYY